MTLPTVIILSCSLCHRERIDQKSATSYFSFKKTTQEVNVKPHYTIEKDTCVDCMYGERFKDSQESLVSLVQQELIS